MTEQDLEKKATRLRSYLWALMERLTRLQAGCGMDECPLTSQELKAVVLLGSKGAGKMREVADHLMLAVSSTTALVDNLEAKGMVRRERSESDRRVVLVRLTEEGQQQYEKTAQEYLKFCQGMLLTLDGKDQDRLLELYRKMSQSSR
jgi:DNA-binding MarR family transcriptional regulator